MGSTVFEALTIPYLDLWGWGDAEIGDGHGRYEGCGIAILCEGYDIAILCGIGVV